MTLTLARLSPPRSDTTTTVRDLCHDRLEVVAEGDIPSLDEARNPRVRDEFELRAIQATNLFLGHCRVVSRSPFVLGVQRHFRLQDQKFYVLTPHTIAWFDGESGTRLPVFEGGVNAQAASGAIPSPERDGASMDAIHASISRGPLPGLAESLLRDAEAALVTLRVRETLLELGTAPQVPRPERDCLRRTPRQGEEMGWFQHDSTIVVFAPHGFTLHERVREGALIHVDQLLMQLPLTSP